MGEGAFSDDKVPGAEWTETSASAVGLDIAALDRLRDHMQGRGCIVRHGRLAYSWGDIESRVDVWSAAKPVYAHFLLEALLYGLIPSLDALAITYQPELHDLNPELAYKDRKITLAHMAKQISCYGVEEAPGTAFDYNDWQMALLIDILFMKIYGAGFSDWDTRILHPRLTDVLRCQDHPTLTNYGPRFRQGRLAMSVRDFARFGLLYLREGDWNGRQLITPQLARMAVSQPLPAALPRAGFTPAEMLRDQRTIGSQALPDNQDDHYGSYSWCWWVNGVDKLGRRFLGHAPTDVYCASGDESSRRGMAVMPAQSIVFAWNDTVLDVYPKDPRPLEVCLVMLMEATRNN